MLNSCLGKEKTSRLVRLVIDPDRLRATTGSHRSLTRALNQVILSPIDLLLQLLAEKQERLNVEWAHLLTTPTPRPKRGEQLPPLTPRVRRL
jgi:hypothetical protein